MTPSALDQVVIVAEYELRKYLRGRRLLGMLILLALIVGLILGLPPALGIPYPSTPNAFVAILANFTGILVLLCGVLFAADALVQEHEKRTGYFLFPNPIRRETIVVGKLLGSLAASALILTLYYVAATVAAVAVTGAGSWEIGLSYAYALAYMVCVVGVSFLISAILRTTISATILTFFLFFLIFNIVQGVLLITDVDPWFLPTAAAGIIGDVLAPAGPGPGPGFGYVPDVGVSLAVFAAYFLVGAVAAVFLYARRELVA
ncbi:MAG TPA: ABC transporter permease [Thermoplasmata archaeon]|nr:ABC transporter permease [Thermoplasmata archaeon]